MARRRPATAVVRLVPRKVYYYARQTGHHIDLPRLFAAALSWPPSDQLEQVVAGDDRRLVCRVDHPTWPIRVSLGHVRYRNLPALMNLEGEERPIDADEDEGVLDRTRFVFFRTGVVGCEMNIYGPRFESLMLHLAKRPSLAVMIGAQPPQFRMLLRDDALSRLDELGDLTLLRIRAHRDVGKTSNTSLAKQIDQISKQTESYTVEIVLRGEPRGKSYLFSGAKDMLKKFIGLGDNRTLIEKMDVKGIDENTGKQVPLDLLADKLVISEGLTPENPRTRLLKCTDVYALVEKGYVQLEAQLLASLERNR
ncbi:MAG: hypothetical protein JWO38_6832 [Gemmataceae bacterium]|nr:hypothetical protein [Gemmataceae bacterium]